MSIERFVGSATELGPREIGIIASTSELARDGDVVIPSGIDLTAYKQNPVVLFNHDYARPVGSCTAIGVEGGSLAAKVEFAPPGISLDADLVCNLVKAGTLRGISIGFLPKECEPLDPKNPYGGGQRITAADLLEISVVAVPADTNALVVARSFAQRPGAMRILRSLIPTSPEARARALARLGERRSKVGTMNEFERAAFYRNQHAMRTMTGWASGQAFEAEEMAERRARVAALDRGSRE